MDFITVLKKAGDGLRVTGYTTDSILVLDYGDEGIEVFIEYILMTMPISPDRVWKEFVGEIMALVTNRGRRSLKPLVRPW
jgi:hypothetical protein